MAESLSALVQSAFGEADELRPLVRDLRVRDFQSVTLGSLDFGSASEIGDDQPLPTLGFAIRQAARAGALKEFGGAIGFSRKTMSVFSDQIPAAFADHAALTLPAVERRLLAQALEGADCPTVTASGLDVSSLAAAGVLMRNSTNASGQILNLAAKTLIVPAEMETTARVLREAMGARDLALLVIPELSAPAKYWLACDPRRSAPITRLRLMGGTTPTVYRYVTPEGNTKLALRLETDILYSGQPGLIRGGS
ncbi:MAG: hypothetical protein IPK83_24975 [Planctomycetes bacterium]|nr:hypothetical protein [Planctomycetota bacterium]